MPNKYEWKCEEALVSGLWKFNSNVSLQELETVALEWKERDYHGWQELYIRGVGPNHALGIGFRYQLSGINDPDWFPHRSPEQAQKDFFHKMTDQLKRRFGNDFIGWDVSRPTRMLAVT
jgi:hypothetical protein